MRKILLLAAAILISVPAFAQQQGSSPCPPGMVPGEGACFAPNDPDRFGGEPDGQAASPRAGQKPPGVGDGWIPYEYEESEDPFQQSRYGAVVDSQTSNGTVGISVNKKSAEEARKAAFRMCEGDHCKLVLEFVNSCVAVMEANEGISYASDATVSAARKTAAIDCRASKFSGCKLLYSGCSLRAKD